jgi:hypothetical protein
MPKPPAQIARALRAFRNAHRLGLLREIQIVPGTGACAAARAQRKVAYLGGHVPRLPLPRCTAKHCLCDYTTVATDKLRPLPFRKSRRFADTKV